MGGGTDDTRNAGVFFEMRQRVNLPFVDKYIREALSREGYEYTQQDEGMEDLLENFYKFMPNKKLKAQVTKQLAWHREVEQEARLQQARARNALGGGADAWELNFAEDLKRLTEMGSESEDDSTNEQKQSDGEPTTFKINRR